MAKGAFDGLFEQLGLESLPPGGSCDVTFLPQKRDDTVVSAPKPDSTVLEVSHGTLPRLQLGSGGAPGMGDGELVPLQVLGEGGMGRVLLARQSALGRDVAVKVLRGAAPTKVAAEALVHEARTAGSLEHPSVVPIYALARDGNGLPALVMKRVEGVSWRELLRTPSHPAWDRLGPAGRDRLAFHIEVLVQVCNAVAHAHQRGVFHRDLKPANVLLGELGEVYLADWGVALTREERVPGPPRLAGTPAYLAPEMVLGDLTAVDERTDVYLLGATLHEVLTGRPPHVGTDLKAVLQLAYEAEPPELPDDAPALLAAACRRALAAEPEQRFQSATALRDELKRFLQHRGSATLADAAFERLKDLEAQPEGGLSDIAQHRWYTLVTECRFGFTQALKASPDNTLAREGLRRCLLVAAKREAERGLLASARAYVAELHEPPPAALAQQLDQLAQREGEKALQQAEFQRLAHELDPEVARTQRTALLFALAGTMVLLAAVFVVVSRRTDTRALYDGWLRVAPVGIITTIYLGALAFGRRQLLSNRVNRQLMALIGAACLGVLVNRALGVVNGVPLHASVTADSVLMAVLLVNATFTFHWGFLVPAGLFAASAVGAVLLPEWSVLVFGLSASLAAISAAQVYRIWRGALDRP